MVPCKSASAHEVYPHPQKKLTAIQSEKFYVGYLFGASFLLLPEIITEFELRDDLTFSLESELYRGHPFVGTYLQVNNFVVQAEGTTGRYYDEDFEEAVNIDCTFTAYLLGFRGLLVVGKGLRSFTFFDGSKPILDDIYFFAFDFVDL